MNALYLISALLAGALVVAVLVWRGRRQNRRFWLRLALVCILVICLALAAVANILAYQRSYALVHPARTWAGAAPESVGITGYQEVRFETPDGLQLAAWYIPPQNGAVVIAVHGFAGNRAQYLPEAAFLHKAGFGVLLIDSRNSGDSAGDMNSFGLYEVNDIRGALDFLSNQPAVDPERIGLLGHSGGGSTVLLAGAQIPQISAVIAQSTFTSLEDNISTGVRQLLGLPPFPFAPLVVFWGERISGMDLHTVNPAGQVKNIAPRPLLIMHGALDPLIPVDNAHGLYQAASEPKELYILAGAHHANLYQVGGQEYADKILRFYTANLLAKP